MGAGVRLCDVVVLGAFVGTMFDGNAATGGEVVAWIGAVVVMVDGDELRVALGVLSGVGNADGVARIVVVVVGAENTEAVGCGVGAAPIALGAAWVGAGCSATAVGCNVACAVGVLAACCDAAAGAGVLAALDASCAACVVGCTAAGGAIGAGCCVPCGNCCCGNCCAGDCSGAF